MLIKVRKDLAKGPKVIMGSSPVRRSHVGRKTTMDPSVIIALRVPTVAIRAERGESEAHAGGERGKSEGFHGFVGGNAPR